MRHHPRAPDLAVTVVLFGGTLLATASGPPLWRGQLTAAAILAAGIAYGALAWRRRWPLATLAAATAGAAGYLVLTRAQGLVLAAPMVALYNAADTTGRRSGLTVGWLAVLALASVHTLSRPVPWFGWENLALLALGGLAIAGGDAARSRRAYIAEVEERARHAERDREQEAKRRVTEERLRIARDLHDVVGHHLALINVQAGVATLVFDDQPTQAKQALAHIRQASRSGLDELRDTIGLLREPGDVPAPTAPNIGLSGVDELAATFRRSGLCVDHDIRGVQRPLPSAADLTAYRVIQESLTNVRKHAAAATARIELSYGAVVLRIVVEDDGNGVSATRGGTGVGHGIAGMRERVVALGGSLEAGPRPGGGFRVSAQLPLAGGSKS